MLSFAPRQTAGSTLPQFGQRTGAGAKRFLLDPHLPQHADVKIRQRVVIRWIEGDMAGVLVATASEEHRQVVGGVS